MTNKQLIEKLKEDMEMRGFSHYTKEIEFLCKNCDRYKEKNAIDIFELLKMKEEEEKRKLEENNLEKEKSNE